MSLVIAESPLGLLPQGIAQGLADLRAAFGMDFTLVDGQSGDVVETAHESFGGDWMAWGEMCRAVAESGRAALLAEEDPLLAFAVPLPEHEDRRLVAVGVFLSRPFSSQLNLSAAARAFDMNVAELQSWTETQTDSWSPAALQRSAEALQKSWKQSQRIAKLQRDIDLLADNLADTYEEISLLYRLTHSLKLSCRDEDLGRLALRWLADAVPVESLAVQFLPAAADDAVEAKSRNEAVLLTHGPCPLDNARFSRLVARWSVELPKHPIVINPPITAEPEWAFPEIRQLVLVPLVEGARLFGWLAAFNHREGRELGTVEGSLLGSVAAILGIHSSNTDLYREQAELLSGMVRALTSAIDAKDPYTCGHSDRVARVSVRLGREMGCSPDQLKWLYLSGLLHDVGKIGIDQDVLSKPGRLSETEYQHIQTHTQIGFRILDGIKQLDDVLPVVLHHHEAWDGTGYPSRLAGETIPVLARIVAVADSYDAMASDRPYRKGMPDDRLEEIFRAGTGKQWDARVIAAFFTARDDIRRISEEKREQITLDPVQWM